ncbi:bactoprenol glucosyl transferase [Eubacterium ramulus]|uniref:Bactoprenol glucosyl transferase n=1 Tax=Eubacterium ramulus TaxID=39490 RepID=A0A2V1JUJ2_EUBRA|nr:MULTISPECIES: glycosyltransferase family 2 protein [Clostridia]MBS5191391.1 glycosyltransferase family 2 protein [Lachnospiraceae bacterium]PWE87484.1 bactoprenol glucosyl transferase [Eubacterium ramulus]RHV65338.1 glycosyltransferase [Roseburia sp. OM02-15]
MTKLSLIVPCYNEEQNVEAFYARCQEVFPTDQYEVVFVNDGSKDGTYKKLQKLHEEHDNILVVNFSRNFGKESAIYAGLHYASGSYISIIDADLQQDPEIVRNMVNILEEKPDIDVVAAYQAQRHEGKLMSWCKDRFYKFINRLSEVDLRENASDFRTFRASVQKALLDMPEYFRFSKGLFSWVGFETEYIPYEAAERFAGTTKWSFTKLLKYAMEGIISFSTLPLQLATFFGAIVSAIAIIYGIVIIAQTLITGIDVPGYATTIVVVLFLGGVQLLVMGILGEYLAKTYIQGKHRPVYIAKNVLEKKNTKEEN